MHFGDELIQRTRALGHPLCVGIDPHIDRIPALFGRVDGVRSANENERDQAAATVESFCMAILERVVGRVAAIKPQIAFFEQFGWRGLRVLETVVQAAHLADVLVILDAKRSDIGSTARGYAAAYLQPGAPLEVDAMTLNPYLGIDTIEPYLRDAERGVFVLVKTSNPGSADFQDLDVNGEPLFTQVANALSPVAERFVGETGWSSIGVVVGATWAGPHQAVRERLPNSPFLVPGYGAQGGTAADALGGFTPGPQGLEGGVVSSSRGVLFPEQADAASDVAGWESAIDRAIDSAIAEMTAAVGN